MWLVLILEVIPKAAWNCVIVDLLIRKQVQHLNEHIIYYNLSFLIEQSFWKLSSLLHNLVYRLGLSTFSAFPKSLRDYFFNWLDYKCLLNRFSVLINYSVLCGLPIIFLHPTLFHVFHRPGFSGSRSRVWVQVLELAV